MGFLEMIFSLFSILQTNDTNLSDDFTNSISLLDISDSRIPPSQDSKWIDGHFTEFINGMFKDYSSKNDLLDKEFIKDDDESDSTSFNKINEYIHGICENDPNNPNGIFKKGLCKIIEKHDNLSPIKHLYGTVMKRLNLSKGEEQELTLDNINFLKNLDSIVKGRRNEFPNDDIFWIDLKGFALKIILHLRQESMINASNSEFERVSNYIRSISFMTDRNSHPVVYSNFNLHSMNADSFNPHFLNMEFFRHSNHLSGKFIKALEYVYSPLFFPFTNYYREKKGKFPNFNCNEFKKEFFKDGNPNTNILLKLFMSKYDNGGMIRKCLEFNIRSPYSKITKESIEQIEIDIDGLRFRGIKHFIGIPYMKYANSLILNFILLNGKKVLIEYVFDLYWLLKRMKETGLLNGKNIETIIEFQRDENKWDQNTFEEYLKEYGKDSFDDIKVIEFINECLELFELESLREESIE